MHFFSFSLLPFLTFFPSPFSFISLSYPLPIPSFPLPLYLSSPPFPLSSSPPFSLPSFPLLSSPSSSSPPSSSSLLSSFLLPSSPLSPSSFLFPPSPLLPSLSLLLSSLPPPSSLPLFPFSPLPSPPLSPHPLLFLPHPLPPSPPLPPSLPLSPHPPSLSPPPSPPSSPSLSLSSPSSHPLSLPPPSSLLPLPSLLPGRGRRSSISQHLLSPASGSRLLHLDAVQSHSGWLTIAAFLVFSSLCQWFLWPCVNPDDHSSTSATTTTVLRTTAEAAKNLPGTTRPSFISILSTMLKAIMGQGEMQRHHNLPILYPTESTSLSTPHRRRPTPTQQRRTNRVPEFMVVLVVILVVYSGNLTAFLSMPHVDRPPSTIHDIVTMGWTITLNKAYGSHDLVKVISNLSETQTEDYQILYQRALRRGMVKENQGVQRTYDIDQIRDEDIAYVMGKTGADVITNREMSDERQCTLDYGREAIGEAFSAMAFPKMSLIKPYFDAKLRWMRQMGVIHNYYNNYFGIRCFQSSNRKSEKRAMKLDQVR
ncbi:hypothetical protein C7M84_020013 [Penaeus vannamei]|uniref:Ionotropic glutamate receptor C-terminal domain-containing protein n=1 Tax=Penaeus vannamei TaxID=6689 RepID=A0A3R7QAY7_PENVA|nr:hypothetical protein C7M84_020013 [Penaeus vannamei]